MQSEIVRRIRTHPSLLFILRFVVAAVFIFAGASKINQPGEFAYAIQNYQIIPSVLSNLLAIILPWLEILCGLCLVCGLFSRGSAMILAIITSIFIIAISRVLISGLEIDCGCYGEGSPLGVMKLIEDIFLLFACLHLLWYPSGNLSLDRLFKRLS